MTLKYLEGMTIDHLQTMDFTCSCAMRGDFCVNVSIEISSVLLMPHVNWSPHWSFLISLSPLFWSWYVKVAPEFLNRKTLDNNQIQSLPGWKEGWWNTQLHLHHNHTILNLHGFYLGGLGTSILCKSNRRREKETLLSILKLC